MLLILWLSPGDDIFLVLQSSIKRVGKISDKSKGLTRHYCLDVVNLCEHENVINHQKQE